MEVNYIETIKGQPFIDRQSAMRVLGKGTNYVNRLIAGIQSEKDRYSRYAVTGEGKGLLVNYYALIDYNDVQKILADKNARKYAPPFDPVTLAWLTGFGSREIKEEI